MVARVGGDEFAVMLDGVDLHEGQIAARRLQDAVKEIGDRVGIELDLSVGLVCVGTTLPAEEVLAAADSAMYEMKRSNAGHIAVKW